MPLSATWPKTLFNDFLVLELMIFGWNRMIPTTFERQYLGLVRLSGRELLWIYFSLSEFVVKGIVRIYASWALSTNYCFLWIHKTRHINCRRDMLTLTTSCYYVYLDTMPLNLVCVIAVQVLKLRISVSSNIFYFKYIVIY